MSVVTQEISTVKLRAPVPDVKAMGSGLGPDCYPGVLDRSPLGRPDGWAAAPCHARPGREQMVDVAVAGGGGLPGARLRLAKVALCERDPEISASRL
ncbi:hypothetical protein [Streptomyces sp. x-80]|uniref:hypothetical protein n=1 Tax=Streptomyces sp. x-80 TaxID=2789282 RepID=UPI00397ECC86